MLRKTFIIIGIALVFIILLFFLSLTSPKLVWDRYNKLLHGQQVLFKVPMVYIKIDERHEEYGFIDEEIKIGKLLTMKNGSTYHDVLSYGGKAFLVPRNSIFTVEGSYMREFNWLSEGFRNSSRTGLVKDQFGNYFIIGLIEFTESTKPKFSEPEWTLSSLGEI